MLLQASEYWSFTLVGGLFTSLVCDMRDFHVALEYWHQYFPRPFHLARVLVLACLNLIHIPLPHIPVNTFLVSHFHNIIITFTMSYNLT